MGVNRGRIFFTWSYLRGYRAQAVVDFARGFDDDFQHRRQHYDQSARKLARIHGAEN